MRVLIGGGGTGGHLYPGIAVAQALKQRDTSTEIRFIGSAAGLEKEIVPQAGFPLSLIQVQGVMGKNLGAKMKAIGMLPLSLIQTVQIFFRFKPDLVVGVGGYAAGPVVLTASLFGIPRLIHEQNLFPGITNRLLAFLAQKIAISYPDSAAHFPAHKVVLTGNPVRTEIQRVSRKPREKSTEGEGKFHVLIFGGSQGAHTLNMAMIDALPELSKLRDALSIVHQTGKADWEDVRQAYRQAGLSATVVPFISAMWDAYEEADLVICRAGATTLAELAVCGKAALFVPYPYAAHQHQEINARSWQKAGAAEVILQTELTGKLLAEWIHYFWSHQDRVREMGKRSKSLGYPDAAERIVDLCYQLLEEPKLMTGV